MTLAAVADPHIWNHKRHGGVLVRGVNRRGELCLDVLRRASVLAQQRNAELIVAGDLVDSAGPIQPQLAQQIREALPEESWLVVGNHDATAADDHSLGLYAPSERIADKVRQLVAGGWLDRPLATLVPYTADIDDIHTAAPLVVGHFGIYDDSFPPYLRKRPARHVDELFSWMRDRDVRAMLMGDWHRRRVWANKDDFGTLPLDPLGRSFQIGDDDESVIMQIGALVPTGFDNPGLHGYGTVAFWDGERLSWEELPGPRFCTVRSDEEEKAVVAEAAKLGHNLFLRRYYTGDRPETPPGLEAYEALPVAVEQAAAQYLDRPGKPGLPFYGIPGTPTYVAPQTQLDELVSHWLDTIAPGDERAAVQEILRRYL